MTGGFQVGAFQGRGEFAFQQLAGAVHPSGGWKREPFYFDFDRYQSAHRRRLEEQEQAAKAVAAISDTVDAEIGRLLQARIAAEAEDAEIARLQALVKAHAHQASVDADRVQAAIDRAALNLTASTLEALEREVARAQEEEEFALLMVLAMED